MKEQLQNRDSAGGPAAGAIRDAASPLWREIAMRWVFTACACVSILAVALICAFLFANGDRKSVV